MKREHFRARFWQLSLHERIIHCLILGGIPVLCFELYNLWHDVPDKSFIGTAAVTAGRALALFYGLLTAVIAGLIEHALISTLKRHGQN